MISAYRLHGLTYNSWRINAGGTVFCFSIERKKELGHRVNLYSPFYRSIKELPFSPGLRVFSFSFSSNREARTAYDLPFLLNKAAKRWKITFKHEQDPWLKITERQDEGIWVASVLLLSPCLNTSAKESFSFRLFVSSLLSFIKAKPNSNRENPSTCTLNNIFESFVLYGKQFSG